MRLKFSGSARVLIGRLCTSLWPRPRSSLRARRQSLRLLGGLVQRPRTTSRSPIPQKARAIPPAESPARLAHVASPSSSRLWDAESQPHRQERHDHDSRLYPARHPQSTQTLHLQHTQTGRRKRSRAQTTPSALPDSWRSTYVTDVRAEMETRQTLLM